MFCEKDDKEFGALVAENRLITDIQLEIERALDALNMTQADLARLLNVSEARVSQILSNNGKNLQARTIARIAHVLGLSARVEFFDRQIFIQGGRAELSAEKPDVRKWIDSTAERPGYEYDAANDDELRMVVAV